jgi:small subunit ribosomal protein S21
MRVDVRNNNVDQALRVLKKKLQLDGLFNELREREHYVGKSEKRRRSKAAAVRRQRKENAKREEEFNGGPPQNNR